MSNQFLKLRRSSVPGKIPTTSSLEFGEIALNTYDGLAFIKKSGSNGEEVIAIGSTSGSFTGSLFGTASYALFAATSSYSTNINGEQYYVAIFNTANELTSSYIFQSGAFTSIRNATAPEDPTNPDILYVNGYGVDTYNLISAHADYDNYVQLNVQNFSSGSTASADIVASNNTATETTNFINMGINGDGYAITDGIGAQNDAYLFSTGENLLIGNASEGKKVIIFNGTGSALDNARVFIVPEGTVGINSQDPNPTNPESLLVEPIAGASNPTDFNNLIIGKGTVQENYLQLNITNFGTGSAASSDIVATNDIGDETSYYIDMGVNSSGYNTPNAVGTASDAYLYSTAEHLHIGNASAGMPIMFFAGGIDAEANRKLELWPDNYHIMTGSLEASEGFTGSLYGTASWALNTLTASYVANAVSASYAATASWAINALTASSADNFTVRGSLTGSDALFTGTITAQRLNVQYITSSTDFVTGSTKFGTQLTDTHQFTGSVSITGSLTVNGPLNATSSWAQNAVSASYVPSSAIVGDISRIATGSVTASVNINSASFQITSGSSTFLFVSNSGNVGIGTNTPFSNGVGGGLELVGAVGRFGVMVNRVPTTNRSSWLTHNGSGGGELYLFNNTNSNTVYLNGAGFSYFTATSAGLGIGTTTDSGDTFQVSGSTLLRGNGNTSGTTALTVQNSDASGLFRVRNDGVVFIGNAGSTAPAIYPQTTAGSGQNLLGTNLGFYSYTSNQEATLGRFWFGGEVMTQASGNTRNFYLASNFSPTSGTAIHTNLYIRPTINQTGGANGVTRGILIEPVLTSAADWRSIEWNNSSGWGLYGAGTANNYLAGSLGIGSTTLTNVNLRISKNISGSASSYGFFIDSTVSSGVTSQAIAYTSNLSLQNTAFTLSNLINFYAIPASSFGSATVNNQFGFLAESTLTGATNNYGFYGNIASASGRWNLYMNGTAANYLNGDLLLGSTTSTGEKLQVTGAAKITGSLTVTGSLNAPTITGSLFGTASWALNAVTASYFSGSITNAVTADTASFVTASNVYGPFGSNSVISSSYALTASFALNAGGAAATFPYTGSATISGSLLVTGSVSATQGGFTGSLLGTASWAQNSVTASFVTASNVWGPFGSNSVLSSSYAVTASFALNAGGASVTNRIATGSVTASVNVVSASFQVTSASIVLMALDRAGALTASRAFLSSSNGTVSGSTLILYGSGSAQPVFTVQGSQGELFSVSDSLSGSLFSVNDISGLPVIEAFSDNRVLIGSYQAPALFTTVRTTSTAGANVIYSVPTASYDAVFFEYSLRSGSNARAGQIMSIWSGSDTNWTETVTADFGNTTGVTFRTIITGSSLALTGSFPSASWTMKTIIRGI